MLASAAQGQYPTKASAWLAAKPLRDAVENQVKVNSNAPTVSTLIEQYRAEKMPQRYSTRRGYESYLRHRILPRWRDSLLTDAQARPVELWLQTLALSPKTRAEIRGLLRILWDFAMWCGDVPTQRIPMELVTVKDASKRIRQPRSLSVDEFHKFIERLQEPFRTVALVCICFGFTSLNVWRCDGRTWIGSTANSACNVESSVSEWVT
jgi:hypothetical protein